MGFIDKLFGNKKERQLQGYFKTLSAYTPVFTTFEGGLYEMEITRSAIHAIATHCSKLEPQVMGTAYKNLDTVLKFQPNPFMDTTKFLYRLSTILSIQNTAFIVPVIENGLITGYYPILPSRCEVMEYSGEPWLRYTFNTGEHGAIELARTGILTQFQYKSDFFGESNLALNPTMQLVHAQQQGIENGIRQSAAVRFLAHIGTVLNDDDMEAERARFTQRNLAAENNGGVMIFDERYADVKQILSKPYIVDAEQMKLIEENVYNYFGVNGDILQNKSIGDQWSAFYEGKIEPFALQLGLVMSNMTFSPREIAFGNQIMFTSNRMQYMTNADKLQVSTQLFDRGLINRDQAMDIWNMPHVEGGDKYYIRKEYAEVSKLDNKGELDDKQGPAVPEL